MDLFLPKGKRMGHLSLAECEGFEGGGGLPIYLFGFNMV